MTRMISAVRTERRYPVVVRDEPSRIGSRLHDQPGRDRPAAIKEKK